MGLAGAYKSWRHGRGYGVHSPYAYRMVREVLNPPRGYAYYAYGDIVREISRLKAPVRPSEALLVFRAVLALSPATVALKCYDERVRRLLAAVVRKADPSATLADDGEMLLCMGLADTGDSLPRHAYFSDSRHPSLARIADMMTYGHVYRNRHRALVAGMPHLPRQIFDISF